MKQLLLICAVVMVGCASTPKVVPNSPEAKAAIKAEGQDEPAEQIPTEREKLGTRKGLRIQPDTIFDLLQALIPFWQ